MTGLTNFLLDWYLPFMVFVGLGPLALFTIGYLAHNDYTDGIRPKHKVFLVRLWLSLPIYPVYFLYSLIIFRGVMRWHKNNIAEANREAFNDVEQQLYKIETSMTKAKKEWERAEEARKKLEDLKKSQGLW